ncbi:MAG: hypothetical protein WCX95_01160 [Candidatus Gracilibacteria bacterium]
MKKIVLYILFSLIINYSLGIAVALANTENNQVPLLDNSRLIADGRQYEAPIIDKPDTQPGPTKAEQLAKDSNSGNASSTRKILTEILLPKATTGFIGFVGMASFLMLVVSGVRFVVAYGNDEAIGKAKNEAMYAIVGLIIALLAYAIVTIVANLDLTAN